MHRIMATLVAAVAATMSAPAPAADLPDGAYGWMAELAGSCWSAAYPDGTRDTQCYGTQFGRYLRGTIEIVAGGEPPRRPPYRGDSVFFWDPERSEMAVHFWSDAGSHGIMTGRVEGAAIVFESLPRADGAPTTRTVWTRNGPDSFRVVQQRREGEQWNEALALVYSRAATAPDSD